MAVNVCMNKITGGYYIKSRAIQESDIAHAPPHVREIWDWLLREANHKDTKVCKRGSLVRSYKDIQEGLAWYVGWRKETYSKHQCEIAMKWLKKATMITTRKTTRGIVINIDKYDYYQNPNNYESHKENYTKATRKPQTSDTINKNDNNYIKINLNRRTAEQVAFQFPKESEAIVLENNQSEAVVKESREGKPSKGRNVVVDHTLEEFKRIVGYYPTDRHPRRIAWNIQQKFTTITRERLGGEVTDERLKKGITTFFNWLSGEDWINKVERLETIKNKLPKFEATLPERGA